ncbi:MAG: hypothetical protein QM718_03290 [Steroidobacteraceae bacterium]
MKLPGWLSSDAWRRGPGPEALVLACALAIGVVVVPLLIWVVGSAALGPYAGGSVFSLWGAYLSALVHFSLAFWLLALAPYALLWFVRIWRGVLGA